MSRLPLKTMLWTAEEYQGEELNLKTRIRCSYGHSASEHVQISSLENSYECSDPDALWRTISSLKYRIRERIIRNGWE